MPKGQDKKDYQGEYMRKRRLKGGLLDLAVRPDLDALAGRIKRDEALYMGVELDADGNPVYND